MIVHDEKYKTSLEKKIKVEKKEEDFLNEITLGFCIDGQIKLRWLKGSQKEEKKREKKEGKKREDED